MFRRAVVIVLDSVGAGELPDAALYGDQGSHTLGHIADAGALNIPTLTALGLGCAVPLRGIPCPAGRRERRTGCWPNARRARIR